MLTEKDLFTILGGYVIETKCKLMGEDFEVIVEIQRAKEHKDGDVEM